MIVWDVALRRNIGANHGKSMVWPAFSGGWRILDASCGDWPPRPTTRPTAIALHRCGSKHERRMVNHPSEKPLATAFH